MRKNVLLLENGKGYCKDNYFKVKFIILKFYDFLKWKKIVWLINFRNFMFNILFVLNGINFIGM